ncbi:MAG: hypothetical protein WD065_19040 [Planctomycetaceae bacterium]
MMPRLLFLIVLFSSTPFTLAAEPVDIGHNWQLFLDDYIVARATGLDRVLHPPRPRGVVLPADKPWETYGVELLYGTPVGRRADGTFFMFYRAMWWSPGTDDGADRAHHMTFSVGYATSEDGIHWEKPNLGLSDAPAEIRYHDQWPESAGSTRENNIGVPIMDPTDLGTYGNVADPQKRFLLRVVEGHQEALSVTGGNWEAFFAAELPDFINDENWREKLTPTGSTLSPRRHYINFWDDIHNEWVALDQGIGGHWLPSRDIARLASPDLQNWTGEVALYPDAHDPHSLEHYEEPMTLHPYYSDGVVFGLLSWFRSDRTDRNGGPVLKPDEEHPHYWPWSRKGICDARITISRDGGKTWDRTVSRKPWIACSPDEHASDRQAYRPAPPVRVGDEDYFYVTTMNGDHLVTRNTPGQESFYHDRVVKMEILLYTQRHHGFVSMRGGGAEPEVLITKPVILNGDRLELNVDASHGEVRVAIASAEPRIEDLGGGRTLTIDAPHLAQPFSGFSFGDCEPIRANSVRHEVQFKDDRSLEQFAGKPVYLMFQLFDADLYGFRAAEQNDQLTTEQP